MPHTNCFASIDCRCDLIPFCWQRGIALRLPAAVFNGCSQPAAASNGYFSCPLSWCTADALCMVNAPPLCARVFFLRYQFISVLRPSAACTAYSLVVCSTCQSHCNTRKTGFLPQLCQPSARHLAEMLAEDWQNSLLQCKKNKGGSKQWT